MRMLKQALLAFLFVVPTIQANAETAEERVHNNYLLCMQTFDKSDWRSNSAKQKYCWQSAFADVYVPLYR